MSIISEEAAAAQHPLRHVSDLTAAKIRAFLFEVAEGISNYRSLHSLTEQVEHQYHGRFLIELVQNAHDALSETLVPGQPSRIAVVLDTDDSKYGSLLVANDGQPFTRSNFERLSQLGQSDKDPQQSIGNKGLGFRSVLEISERPEVYSRASSESRKFDGYCFAFEPEVVQSLVAPMEALATGYKVPLSPISDAPIVDWEENLLRKFRSRVRSEGRGWLRAETKYLSPYLLPVPRRKVSSPQIRALEAQGFATVVRLPLKSKSAHELVRHHMEQLSSTTLLFLDRVTSLELRLVGASNQIFTRSVEHGDGAFGQRRILIGDSAGETREYSSWTRELRVSEAPDEFKAAVAALPGRWPEIQDVSVSIAVRLGEKADPGVFSIFLPTEVATGSAVHINAPFFGNMSRTDISFKDAYNAQLLQTACELSSEVVRAQLAGRGPEEARAIVDVICPLGDDERARKLWQEMLAAAIERAGGSIDEEELILADAGWRPLNRTSLVPDVSGTSILTESVLREHATFDTFHVCLSSRLDQLVNLAQDRYDVGASPTVEDLAATIAAVAKDLHASGSCDWNAFWRDVLVLLPYGQKALAEYKVLFGTDGQLHDARGGAHVFFIPRQGTPDDSEGGAEGSAGDVPPSLQPLIAFLNDEIAVYEPGKPNVQTPVRTYLLNGGLVSQFRVETIFSGALRGAVPALPVKLNGPGADRCRDVLVWSLRLMSSVVARDRGSDAMLSLLKPMPVPCRGGWFPMSEATFGRGWPDTSGDLLSTYLKLLPRALAKNAASRVLLSPDHAAWGGQGYGARYLLAKGGVFDGLRLQEVKPEDWSSEFRASTTVAALPSTAPPGVNSDFWFEYVRIAQKQIKFPFASIRTYEVGSVWIFPGMTVPDLPEEAHQALSQLILRSAPKWHDGWEKQSFSKREGQIDNRSATSALCYYLQTRSWLAITSSKGETIWAKPSERWHVPSETVYRRATHYAHLRALPYEMAKQLDDQKATAAVLHRLGMPYLDLHSETGNPQLLRELIGAIGSSDAPESDVLFGQIRDAWHRFRPPIEQEGVPALPVRDQYRQLAATIPGSSSQVYLPDLGTVASGLEQFGLPVVAIYSEDAKALREWFASAYGSAVAPTSQLKLVPRVGGEEWHAVAATAFGESSLAWLVTPMLALVAFYGQIRGVHSSAFQDRMALLKEARLEWVQGAEVVVMSGDEELIRTPVRAHWDTTRKALLVSEDCKSQPDEMSVALAQMLGRDDLALPLRFILDRLSSVEEPPEKLAATLTTLGVSDEQMTLVQEYLRGDVGHAGRMIQVLCGVLAPGDEMPDVLSAQSEDDLKAAIVAAGISASCAQEIVRTAKESRDLYDFGSSMARKLGESVGLPRWNKVLKQLGRLPLANHDWLQQLQANLDEACGLIKRVIVHLLSNHDEAGSFKSMLEAYEHLPSNGTDLSGAYWEVNFLASMELAADLVASWPGGGAVAETLRAAITAQDLRERLLAAGVDVDRDPDECCRLNYQLIAKVVDGVERLRQAWWIKTHATTQHGEWQSERENCAAATKDAIGNRAYTKALSEEDVLSVLCELRPYVHLECFRNALSSKTDLKSLRTELQITEEDLADIESRLAAQRAEIQRRQNVIAICGDEFDASEDNRDQLWRFLNDRIKFAEIASTHPLDLSNLASLLPIKPSKGRGPRQTKARVPPRKMPRQAKAIDELIGLAGEIFVFEMLKREYGSDAVTASSWRSGNSRYVFQDNDVDDGMGCDFAFTVRGRAFRVEVKATAGDDECFTLGSSEIALAMAMASQRKSQRGRFILVHVKEVLSPTPQAVVLPNPYEAKSSNVFTIEEADARVRYKSSD